MAVANTLAYYNIAIITAVKTFMEQGLVFNVINFINDAQD